MTSSGRAQGGRRRRGRRRRRAAMLRADAPLLVVAGRARRPARSRARRARALDGQGHRASPARSARPRPRRRCGSCFRAMAQTHASAASYNNHWGVPLTLARMPATARYGVFEIGMNHAGEIAPLSRAGAPACRDHHHDRAGASRIFPLDRGDRRRQGGDLLGARAGRRRHPQPRQSRIYERLKRSAQEAPASPASFPSARTPRRDARLVAARCSRRVRPCRR